MKFCRKREQIRREMEQGRKARLGDLLLHGQGTSADGTLEQRQLRQQLVRGNEVPSNCEVPDGIFLTNDSAHCQTTKKVRQGKDRKT